uniref:Neur_chan_LBD domain-containing protein n=1 Tax=Heterorhabditis bacteriophora TaxID=37862 RepID=A0A1I7XR47_HETBA
MKALSVLFCSIHLVFSQNAADLEFSPFVYSAVNIPFKSYLFHFNLNEQVACFSMSGIILNNCILAPAKPSKPGNPVALPTIAPLVVSWRNLDNTHINDENEWNFEKRVDSKVWWPNK